MSGYIMDGWGNWRVICLATLDVEDVEDVYVFAFMTTGMIALGCGIFMLHRKMRKIATEVTGVRVDNATTRSTVVGMGSDISAVRDSTALVRVEVATNREEIVTNRSAMVGMRADLSALREFPSRKRAEVANNREEMAKPLAKSRAAKAAEYSEDS